MILPTYPLQIRLQIVCFLLGIFCPGQTVAEDMSFPDANDTAGIAHLDRGVMLMFQGETEAAISQLEKAAELGPNRHETQYYLAMGYAETKLWNSTIDATTKSLSIATDDIESFYLQAKAYFNLGEWVMAESKLKRVIQQDPFHARALKIRGQTQLKQRQFARATQSLLKASELNPFSTVIQYYLGMSYLNRKMYQQAVTQFEESIQLAPGYAQPYHGLGTAFLRLGEREKGQSAMAEFQRLQKSSAEYERLSRLTQVDPDNVEAWTDLAHVSMESFNYQLAIKIFRRCLQYEPQNVAHHLGLSRAFISLDQPVPARQALFRAIEISPNEPILYNTLGSTYAMQGEVAKAIGSFQRAAELDPAQPYYHLNLARLYQQIGEQSLMQQHYLTYEKLLAEQTKEGSE